MLLSNVNIGSGPSAGDGDPLRSAFATINDNFAIVQSNVNVLTNSVSSVAGRTGNIILTVNDVIGAASIAYVDSKLSANVANIQANLTLIQADINTLYGNAGVQSSTLATLTSNAATQAGSLATLTANAATQAGELTTLLSNAAVQAGAIASLLSNAGSQHEAISSLQSNVSTLFSNAGTQADSITTLTSNAAVQAGLIAGITNGTALFGNIIPSANVTYSLGNVTHQWKDLWVSNNTIYINSVPLSIDAGGNLLINGAPVSGGAASTADITFANTSISAADDSEITVDAKTAERIRAKLRLEPTSGDAYLEAWSGQNTRSENDTNWTTGVWENNIYGNPLMTFTGAFDLAFFVVETLQSSADPDTVSYSINGGPYIAWDGGSSADTSTGYVQIYTSGVSPNVSPTDITSLDWRYAYKSSMGISHGSGAIQITGRNQYLQVDIDQYILVNSKGSIEFNNSNYGNNVDIELRSGDDILLQAKDKTTSDNEGGDILIYAGDGGDADAGDPAGTGGDIVIEAGIGGSPSAAYDGAAGGTLDLYGGAGGSADTGNNRAAKDGGRARLRAGSAGSNGGNIALGAVGGPVEITAGLTTLANANGGTVTITSGNGGANALAGYVEINIPSSDLGPGGSWYFTGTGRTLEAPQDGEIWQPNAGNLSVASAGNVFVRSYDGDQHEWQFGHNGDLTIPGNITMGPGSGRLISVVTPAPGIVNWEFGTDGTITLPGGGSIDGADYDVDITAGNDGVSTFGHISFTANGPNGLNSLTYNSLGEITVVTAGANDGLIKWVGNSSGDGAGYTTMTMVPDATREGTDQYIIIDPTGGEPGHIHLRAGGTQDASGADLYLGGELTAVRVSDTSGIVTVRTTNIGDPNITMDWAFQPDGNLYFPGIGDNRIGESEPGLVVSSDNSVVLQSNNAGTSKEWLFNANASITFPDMTVQTTAWTGTVAYGNTIALGYQTGNTSQGNNAVAIGSAAGQTSQGAKAIGIGEVAGRLNQGIESVGLGAGAGEQNQGAYAIAIGSTTAYQNQGVGAVAIGTSAGSLYQGEHAIAIGTGAGAALQGNNSIILNATGSTLDQTTDDTFTVKPIRAASAGNVLYYDPSSGEITYSTNSGGGSYGNANVAVFLGSFGSNAITTTGNISAANVRANNNVHFGTGNARITSDDNTSVYLTPDTAANALAGVKIGGNGYLLASNGARNITLNYGSVNGAVGLQANVTVGTSASSILTVNGNVTANNISTIGSILSTGASGKIGYSAGGYVVQSGNTSGVTLNTVSGNIQLDTVNIAVNTSHTVALTNNKLDANDIILVQGQDSSALDLHIGAYYLTTNTAIIYLRNISGSSIGPIAPMLKFIIVKAPGS